MTEAHGCEQLAQSCHERVLRTGFELVTIQTQVQCSSVRVSHC